MQADGSSVRPRPVRRLSALTKKTKPIATSPGKSVSPAKTSTIKTDAARTGAAKTGSAKTGTAKTGTAKTGVVKTGAAKTGASRTTAAKAGSAKAGSVGTTKTGYIGSGAAKTTTAKTSTAKTDTVKASTAKPGVTKTTAKTSAEAGSRTKTAKVAKADVGRPSKTATKVVLPAKDIEPAKVAEGQKKNKDKDSDSDRDEVTEDKAKGDEVKGDEIKGDEVKGDEVTGDDVTGDEVKGDEVTGDEVKEDEVKGDEVKGDEVKGDEVKGDEVKGDEVKEDKGKGKEEDKIQEDDGAKKVKVKDKDRKIKRHKSKKGRKQPETFDEFMEEGVRLEEQGERYVTGEKAKRYYEQAIAMYEQAHELRPKDANSLYNWGRVLYILSNMDTGRSWAQHKTDLLTESIQKFRETLALDHDNADAMYNLAQSLSSMADIIQDADEERGIELASDALSETIQLYDQVYELQQKELNMAQLTDTASESASSTVSAISSSKDIEVASTTSDTESYFEAEPISPAVLVDTLIASSQALSAMGTLVESLEEAEEYFSRAIEKLEQASALGEVAAEDEIQHQWANLYASQADRVFQATGKDGVHQVQRLYELAARKLETVVEHDPDNVEVLCDCGDLMLEYVEMLLQVREGNESKILELFDTATQSFLDALRFEPNNASILQKLGSIHLARTADVEENQHDLYDKALDYYKRALDVQKDDFEGYLFYALALSQVPCRSDDELDQCLHEFKRRGGSARFVYEWCGANQELLKTSATAETFIPRLLEICESPDV